MAGSRCIAGFDFWLNSNLKVPLPTLHVERPEDQSTSRTKHRLLENYTGRISDLVFIRQK